MDDTRSDAGTAPIRIERRHYPRKSVLWAGRLSLSDGDTVDCAVLDCSPGGAKVAMELAPSVGTVVTLISGRMGVHAARVAWTTLTRVGIEFTQLAQPFL